MVIGNVGLAKGIIDDICLGFIRITTMGIKEEEKRKKDLDFILTDIVGDFGAWQWRTMILALPLLWCWW